MIYARAINGMIGTATSHNQWVSLQTKTISRCNEKIEVIRQQLKKNPAIIRKS